MRSGKTPSQIYKIGGGESWTAKFDVVCEMIGFIISLVFFKGSSKTASNLNQIFSPPKVICFDRCLLETLKFSLYLEFFRPLCGIRCVSQGTWIWIWLVPCERLMKTLIGSVFLSFLRCGGFGEDIIC